VQARLSRCVARAADVPWADVKITAWSPLKTDLADLGGVRVTVQVQRG
jgi:hypothetical protein